MQNLKFLDRKDKKRFLELLKKQFGFEEELDYAFLTNNKNKVFIVNKVIANIDLERIRINSIGLYIAEFNNNEVRLSIEGSQIIGKKAKKSVIELDESQAREWLKGNDLEKPTNVEGFVILKHDKDYLGSGRVKQSTILNFVPKTRRLNVSD